MAKITLKNVEAGFNLSSINENFQEIADHLQNKVNYRYNPPGEPNAWQTQQSANSQRLINLPDAIAPTEPVTLKQLNALSTAVQTVGIKKGAVTATDGQTLFEDVPKYVPGSNNLNVYVNGVRQSSYAYEETDKESFTLNEGLNQGDLVEYVVNEYPENAASQSSSSFSTGFIDYNDTSTASTPLALVADTWTTLPNDGLGAFSNDSYAPTGITNVMDSQGRISPVQLELGDDFIIRNDFRVNPNVNNAALSFRYVLGGGANTYTLETSLGRLDDGAGKYYPRSLTCDYIYMGDLNTLNNPIALQVKLSTAGSVINAGSVIKIFKRGN